MNAPMRKFRYGKLVRDRIPDSMRSLGERFESRALSEKEYLEELKKKILEEAGEMDVGDRDGLAGEIADVKEVLEAMVAAIGKTAEEIDAIRSAKNEKAGAFHERIYIDTVELPEGNPWIEYLAAHPERYPEIKD